MQRINLLRLSDRQRCELHAIQQLEDCEIRAYPQSKRKQHGRCKTRRLAKLPKCKANIKPDALESRCAACGFLRQWRLLAGCGTITACYELAPIKITADRRVVLWVARFRS